MNNPCIKCGRQRIDGKSWTEKVGMSVIIHTLTICLDPQCQKEVDKGIADRREKSDLLAKARAEAKLAREKLLATS